ncbi:MAG: glycosyltransferase family 39 protein [Planctomycetaceae bacterium]
MTNPDPNNSTIDPYAVKWRWLMAGLLLVALIARLSAAVMVERKVQAEGRRFLIEGDADGYWELGQDIAAGRDYSLYEPPRRILRVPGFPLLLAASIRMFGNSILAARFLLAVVGTGCCWLTYLLGSRIHMRRTGFWAACFVAIHPLHIGNSVLILSETWFTFAMLLSLLALTRLINGPIRRRNPVAASGASACRTDSSSDAASNPCHRCVKQQMLWALIAGLLTGAAVLIRPGYILWLPIAFLAVLLIDRKRPANATGENMSDLNGLSLKRRLLLAATLATGCLLIMLPWAIRNYGLTQHIVLTSLWSGPSLYDGLNPDADGTSNMRFFDDEFVMKSMSEFDMNQHYRQRALRFATEHPGQTAKLAVAKAAIFLSPLPNTLKLNNRVASAICAVLTILLFLMAAAGIAAKQWDSAGLLVTIAPFLLFLLVHMVFVSSIRYRFPAEFPLAVMAAIGWRQTVLSGRLGRRHGMKSSGGGSEV